MEDTDMKCPCCGNEMNLDGHRKIDMYMCYQCGYIEGRRAEPAIAHNCTNYEKLGKMNINELAAFVSANFGLDSNSVALWLERGAVA